MGGEVFTGHSSIPLDFESCKYYVILSKYFHLNKLSVMALSLGRGQGREGVSTSNKCPGGGDAAGPRRSEAVQPLREGEERVRGAGVRGRGTR